MADRELGIYERAVKLAEEVRKRWKKEKQKKKSSQNTLASKKPVVENADI